MVREAPRAPAASLLREGRDLDRRTLLAAAAAAGAVVAPAAARAAEPARALPEPGDWLTFQTASRRNERLRPELVTEGGPLLAALAVDGKTGTVRDGSRLSRLVLLRLPADALDEQTRPLAAAGVVAYSAVCTHEACTLSAYKPEKQAIACFCHHSEFAAARAGEVVNGPARRRLPMLPLTLDPAGDLAVAAAFTGRPGKDRR